MRIMLMLLFCIAGILSAIWLWGEYVDGLFARWQPLGKPPDESSKFLALEPGLDRTITVYVQTISGKVYHYDETNKQWEESPITSEHPGYGPYGPCYEPAISEHSYFARLPKKVRECFQFTWSWEWVSDISFFVILEDNSVWTWRRYIGFDMAFVFLCSGSIIGSMIGLAIPMSVNVFKKRVYR
ncbi:MAG TPA: hypothetical protein PK299_02740 [Anaerolineales bacterium]|nr:hypothetical protein [Anaerolineales bacterium]